MALTIKQSAERPVRYHNGFRLLIVVGTDEDADEEIDNPDHQEDGESNADNNKDSPPDTHDYARQYNIRNRRS